MTTHLADILVYTFLGFAVIYPFYLWFTPRQKIDSGFYNFNLGLAGLIGGMALVIAWAAGMQSMYIYGIAGWLGMHLLVSFIFWNKKKISLVVISFTSSIGCFIFVFIA
ncbi:MAG: hypothetical protein U9N31_07885, partial [Candidatus Marinimicrobia bacterium]|nr:hypothetical protein [Candidatus Neomarinimicrobiota bacterium]